jgi:muramoyltetrapeptide carboxypeptidase LdcA involved in peptidoglycan recycling
MNILYPPPLQPGDAIGITAPSAGVDTGLEARLQFCLRTLREMGYQVREGQCLRSGLMVSAPAHERANELMAMLLDDEIHAIIPPWGGELLIDILPHLDFEQLKNARPKWILGYSDLTTFMLPYTLLTQVATAHGSNLMETPIQPVAEHVHWNDVLMLRTGASFTQRAASLYEAHHQDWRIVPHNTSRQYDQPVQWKCLHHEAKPDYQTNVSGRLIGGCLDVVSMLPGSLYGNLNAFAQACAPEGLLVYLENCDGNTAQYSRMLQAVRLAGWFEHAHAILLGRSAGPQLREFTMRDAIMDALGDLPQPIFYDLDIGHVPPQLMLVNGALASLTWHASHPTLTQTLA